MRLRTRLRKKALRTNLERDTYLYKKKQKKKKRNHVNNMKKNAKETFYDTIDDMLSRSEIGSKNFWQIMGRIVGKQTSTATILPLCKTDNTHAFDVNEKATTLNEYVF